MEYASKGVGTAGLTTGIIGTALGAMSNGILPNLFSGGTNNCCTSENMLVNRYEAAQNARIAELETEVKLRDANTYTDNKILEVYRYFDGKIDGVNAAICQQSVVNAQITANLSCLQNTVNTLSGLTKTIIPIGNVCPEPMPQYNSFTVPTTGTTAG